MLGAPVSNCRTRAKSLDCEHQYGACLPAADLRDPGGADGRPDHAGGDRVGDLGARGGAGGGLERLAGSDGRVDPHIAAARRHAAPLARRARRPATLPRAGCQLRLTPPPRRNVRADPYPRLRDRQSGARSAGDLRLGATGGPFVAPAVAADRPAVGRDPVDPPPPPPPPPSPP